MSDVVIVTTKEQSVNIKTEKTAVVELEKVEVVTRGLIGPEGAKGDYPAVTDTFILTEQDLVNKYVTLSEMPKDRDTLKVFLQHGIRCDIAIDFAVSGDQLYWDGYGFDGLLEAGDVIIVSYYKQ